MWPKGEGEIETADTIETGRWYVLGVFGFASGLQGAENPMSRVWIQY